MSEVTLKGTPANTSGELPANGTAAPGFTLTKNDLSDLTLSSLKGKNVILNIFPSIDTDTCANSVRKFNEKAASLDNTEVVCISADLPFAQARFCGAEGIDKVHTASIFKDGGNFGRKYGLMMVDGPLKGLLARSVVVVGTDGNVKYSELVSEIVDEPNYGAALAAL